MQWFGRRQKQSLVVLILMVLGIVFYSQRQSDDPESAMRQVIKDLVGAAESKDIGPFKRHLSEQFKDDRGRRKPEVLGIMRAIFLRHPKISLNIASMRFQDSSDPMVRELELTLLMSETSLPTDKGMFWITFRQEGTDWRVWEVVWEDGYGY